MGARIRYLVACCALALLLGCAENHSAVASTSSIDRDVAGINTTSNQIPPTAMANQNSSAAILEGQNESNQNLLANDSNDSCVPKTWSAQGGFYAKNIKSDRYPWNYADPTLQPLFYELMNTSGATPTFTFTTVRANLESRPFYIYNNESEVGTIELRIQFWNDNQKLLASALYQKIDVQPHQYYYGALDYPTIQNLAPVDAYYFHPYIVAPQATPCSPRNIDVIPQKNRYASLSVMLQQT